MEFFWLKEYVQITYIEYIKLLKVFKDEKEIYEASKNSKYFLKLIVDNKLNIGYNIYNKLIEDNLKKQSIIKYNEILNKQIKIINFTSINYPAILKSMFNPPLVFYAIGDISLLNTNIVYKYAFDKYTFLIEDLKCNYISDYLGNDSNIIYVKNILENNLLNIYNDKLVISDSIQNIKEFNYEFMIGISKCMLLGNTEYTIKISYITDIFLEQGKDILVVPGEVTNKKAYFSNYLLRDGAICIISKNDINCYFKNITEISQNKHNAIIK